MLSACLASQRGRAHSNLGRWRISARVGQGVPGVADCDERDHQLLSVGARVVGKAAAVEVFVMRDIGRSADWRIYTAAAAGFAVALAPLLYYNAQVYGQFFTTGYQHHATAKFAAAHAQGLAGIGMPDPVVIGAMTIHPLMGIFWQSPVLLLAFVGLFAHDSKDYRAELCLALAAILAYVTLISGYYEWSGGLAYTPRHLIPVLPLFAIPLAFLPRRWIVPLRSSPIE